MTEDTEVDYTVCPDCGSKQIRGVISGKGTLIFCEDCRYVLKNTEKRGDGLYSRYTASNG